MGATMPLCIQRHIKNMWCRFRHHQIMMWYMTHICCLYLSVPVLEDYCTPIVADI